MRQFSVLLVMLALVFVSTNASAQLVNRDKYEASKKSALWTIAERTKNEGRVQIPKAFGRVISGYDDNGDGFIDAQEARRIKVALSE